MQEKLQEEGVMDQINKDIAVLDAMADKSKLNAAPNNWILWNCQAKIFK